MNALTIEQLKALEIGDWVWIKFEIDNPIDRRYAKQERYFQIIESENDLSIRFNKYVPMQYSDYGKTWTAFKNKEEAQGEYDSRVEEAKKQVAKEMIATFIAYFDVEAPEFINLLCEKYGVEVDE